MLKLAALTMLIGVGASGETAGLAVGGGIRNMRTRLLLLRQQVYNGNGIGCCVASNRQVRLV